MSNPRSLTRQISQCEREIQTLMRLLALKTEGPEKLALRIKLETQQAILDTLHRVQTERKAS